MPPNKLETEAISEHFTISERSSLSHELSSSSSSSSFSSSSSSLLRHQDQRIGDKGKGVTGPRRRVKKLRSIKLLRLPSLKINTTQAKVQFDSLSVLSSDAENSEKMVPEEKFPNYMKTTTSSTARGSLQKSARTLTKRSSFKPSRTLVRLSSTQFRRTLTRKSSAGPEMKRKLKKSRSIKHATMQIYESSLSSSDENRKIFTSIKMNTASSSDKSSFMARTSTLRPLRRLTKVSSLRTRRPSMKKPSDFPDSNIRKATCSSALKVFNLPNPNHLELQPGETQFEGISTIKACPYSYCSLHGHHHAGQPPLKDFVSMRRHQVNIQKSTESQNRSPCGSKHSSNREERIQRKNNTTFNEENAAAKAAHHRRAINSVKRTTERKAYSSRESNPDSDHHDINDSTIFAEETSSRCSQIRTEGDDLFAGGIDAKKVQIQHTGDSASNIFETNTSTDVADDPLDRTNRNTNQFAESRSINDMNHSESASVNEEYLAESEEKIEDTVEDISHATADIGPHPVHDLEHESPKKHMALWHLIYHQMVSGLAAKDEIQTAHDKVEERDQRKSVNALPGINNSKPNQIINMEDHDGGSQNSLLCQYNAIKLVQEAFDKILAEIPDQSSDDQSIDDDTVSNKEVEENDCPKGTKLSTSCFPDSGKDSKEQHPEEVGINGSDGVNTESNVGTESEKQCLKSWSTVRKIIMLKRFVKALEKVKNINPQKPRLLPIEPDPQVEKVNLRHMTTEDRKRSEEWMLDYALQKVISTLDPAEKRKVALLVKAFQTVIPEIGTPSSSNVISSTATPVDSCTGSSDQAASEKGKDTHFDILLHREATIENGSEHNQGHIHSSAAEDYILDPCSEDRDNSIEFGCIPTEKDSSISKIRSRNRKEKFASPSKEVEENQHGFVLNCSSELAEAIAVGKSSAEVTVIPSNHNEDCLMGEQPLLEVSKEVCLECTSEAHDFDSGFNNKKLDTDAQMSPTFEQPCEPKSLILEPLFQHDNMVSSVSIPEPLETSNETTEAESQIKSKFLNLFTSLEKSQPNCTSSVVQENQVKKQKNTRLWYLIYKHMVSGAATLLEGADNEEKRDPMNELIPVDALAHQGSSVTDKDTYKGNGETGGQIDKLQQIEAIRLVEEAIDDIPLPEMQDELPDDPLVSRDVIQENKHLRKELGKESNLVIPPTNGSRKEIREGSTNTRVEQWNECENITTQEELKTRPATGNKPMPLRQNSWSNVKKVILLQRFMKAMEKVKKINPLHPRFLPLEPAEEAEKVNLRHQDIKDRKNSDEWMLDYALQRVVSKLTPERKRKVQLLVEAFETVIPTSWS